MITEDYVNFEIAKLLKEKGFDEPSRFWYDNNGVISQKYIDATDKPLGKDTHYPCVTISFAMKWLREQNKIISILHSYVLNRYRITITQFNPYLRNALYCSNDYDYFSYEEAVEAAIKYCLEILI